MRGCTSPKHQAKPTLDARLKTLSIPETWMLWIFISVKFLVMFFPLILYCAVPVVWKCGSLYCVLQWGRPPKSDHSKYLHIATVKVFRVKSTNRVIEMFLQFGREFMPPSLLCKSVTGTRLSVSPTNVWGCSVDLYISKIKCNHYYHKANAMNDAFLSQQWQI